MAIPNPIVERETRKGREGFVGYMLASLVLGSTPPGYDKPARPSSQGVVLLRRLDELCFGPASWSDPPDFVWEFRLAAKEPNPEKGLAAKEPNVEQDRWPDLAAVWPDRLLLFELKTEAGSIREGQVDEQIDLALHHYPDRRVDMIYLTRDPVADAPAARPRTAYSNVTWGTVAPIITDVWVRGASWSEEVAVAALFAEYLLTTFADRSRRAPSGPKTPLVEPAGAAALGQPEDNLNVGLLCALEVERSGQQQALEVPFSSPGDAQRFADSLKRTIRVYNAKAPQPIAHAAPWVWQTRSGGRAQTQHGRDHGVELRLSYIKKGNGL